MSDNSKQPLKYGLFAKLQNLYSLTLFVYVFLGMLTQPADCAPTPSKEPYQLNVHYRLLASPARDYVIEKPTTLHPHFAYRISVTEFYSFDCHWCYQLEPAIQAWSADLPKTVSFSRVPLTLGPGQNNYALIQNFIESTDITPLRHSWLDIYKAVQVDHINLADLNIAVTFLSDLAIEHIINNKLHDAEANKALRATYQQQLQHALRLALLFNPQSEQIVKGYQAQAALFGITQIPTFVIGGIYETNIAMAEGNVAMQIDIIKYLVKQLSDTFENNFQLIEEDLFKRESQSPVLITPPASKAVP